MCVGNPLGISIIADFQLVCIESALVPVVVDVVRMNSVFIFFSIFNISPF